MYIYPQKVTRIKKSFYVGGLKANDDNSRIRIRIH